MVSLKSYEETRLECPLVDGRPIHCDDCLENSDIVDGDMSDRCVPEEFKEKKNWKDICLKCKWHNAAFLK